MEIREGISEEFRAQAAEIYWLAFRDKLAIALGPERRGIQYFSTAMKPENALIAVENGKLLGLAGFDIGEGGFIQDQFSEFFRIYNFSAFWRMMLLSVFSRSRPSETLLLDGIAVAPDHRAQGVGTALLDAIEAKARAHDLKYIALDVINTNHRARALYLRKGYETTNYYRLGLSSYFFKFQFATHMVKTLD